MRTNQR
jgi:hypothetical protein